MNVKKTILALDTSVYSCSTSLLYKEKTYSLFMPCAKNHEKNILNMIKTILEKKQITLNQIDLIACTVGPGSFTGIRIAIGVSQTISIIYKIPIIGFSTLKILSEQSWNINKINRVFVILQISQKQIFWAKYLKNKFGLWAGNHTEKHFDNLNIITKMIKNHTGTWSVIGLRSNIKISKKSIKLFYTRISTPHAKDIISYTKKYLQYNKISNRLNYIYPRYLLHPVSH
ncbi:tRNA (adenosine(37)-N6)-threonylcarbamoyltransferase complex dimerization subunit type 1 TsaB [Buchnera aphidicola]|uniref:tRNA (adenosine(37)-N6)-threonylcarbamoyltransferase complex dimerization subunit type 1 TsaB n=1 Tax=Buchnera aphidicola TaxID=9 RepID=UPI00094D57E9|nr:tRNA (adenosine(37)-N6)-threonylcarbamoyltransferase complex dimerization subunit type 1 TsaB [Buchnera aphidicola]